MTPNLDATGHQWVSALMQFNFKLEYQKGHDNIVADALSWVTTQLDPDMVRSILDRVTLGTMYQAKVQNHCHIWRWPPTGAKGTCCHRLHTCTNAHYWLSWSPERGPSVEHSLLDWLKTQKKINLRALLAEDISSKEGWLILWNQQNFTIHQGGLYLHSMSKGET